MPYRPGQSGNPRGRPVGSRKRPTALVLRIMKERNDTDPLALLSTIVTTAEAPKSGGLVSYGIDQMEQARGGASYIDRVLRGANPGKLPVQLPTRYELAINLKTAKTLGLKIPESFRADEVLE
jgi:ABC transporter substrate binding protein